jgi:hypothetical protein
MGSNRYSSEITGTIMVQCIPILRPIIRDLHTTLTSRKLASYATGDGQSTPWTATFSRDRASTNFNDPSVEAPERVELGRIPEESVETFSDQRQAAALPLPQSPPQSLPESRYATAASRTDAWPLWNNENRSGKSLEVDQDRASHSSNGFDFEPYPTQLQQGLSPPPRRLPPQYQLGKSGDQ